MILINIKNEFTLGLRLTKDDKDRFDFIFQKIREMKIRKGETPYYKMISKSKAIIECIKIVYDYFKRKEDIQIEMLKELEKSLLRDKIRLFERSRELKK